MAAPSTALSRSSLPDSEDVDESMFGVEEDETTQEQLYDASSSVQPLMAGEKPPPPLPPSWFLKESHSNPGYFYYFNQDTGECCWDIPAENAAVDYEHAAAAVSQDSLNETAAAAAAAVKSILKRSSVAPVIDSSAVASSQDDDEEPTPRKKSKHSHHDKHDKKHHHHRRSSTDSTSETPKEVRVLHILKKHTGSRRPSSWRCAKIKISKEKAIEELRELLAILNEVGDAGELRATFEELAKTESDCSSAKRGGDLGFFGKSKFSTACFH
jgi:NIMA-interacting peptidyl-prolyl cis-trans isomerase 1